MAATITAPATETTWTATGRQATAEHEKPEMVMINGVACKFDPVTYAAATAGRSTDKKVFDAYTTEYGQLADMLGDEAKLIDSLVVHGPVDATDFATMRDCCFYGRTTAINLANAQVKDNIIPDFAFKPPYAGTSYFTNLQTIILPEGITELGESAFDSTMLRHIDLPSSLRKIGKYCFIHCVMVDGDLIIPEGVEEIPTWCFYGTFAKTFNRVELPSTIKTIGRMAFYSSRIKGITIQEGLDSIGDAAFQGSYLTEITIPASCNKYVIYENEGPFSGCYNLKEIRFAEGAVSVPTRLTYNAENVENVVLPSSIRSIEEQAFYNSKVTRLILPESLAYLAPLSCAKMTQLKEIYCLSTIPPLAINKAINSNSLASAFGDASNTGTDRRVTVFVPRGCVESYRQALGWEWFSDFREFDSVPTGIEDINDDTVGVSVYGHDGLLTIETDGSDNVAYSIYTVDGRKTAEGIATGTHTISLPAGFYIVQTERKAFKIRL